VKKYGELVTVKLMSVITQFDGLLVTIGDGQDGQDIH
jgi:hypothetical protein